MEAPDQLFAVLVGLPGGVEPAVAAESPALVAFVHPEPVAAIHWIVIPKGGEGRWPGPEFWKELGELAARAGEGSRLVSDLQGSPRFHVHLLAGRPFGWPPG